MKLITPLLALFCLASCLDADDKAAAKTEGKDAHPAMKDPSKATEKAPEEFIAVFETTKGDIEVTVTREWAPAGADRFYNLVKIGYFQDIAFFRVIAGFMGQFGIHGDPAVNELWRDAKIKDDPKADISNSPGRLSFATSGPDSRTVQLFINLGNNGRLDGMGFTPFGEVTEGMDIMKSIYSGYGEGAPSGRGPSQHLFQAQGNALLKKSFPEMDYIKSARIK